MRRGRYGKGYRGARNIPIPDRQTMNGVLFFSRNFQAWRVLGRADCRHYNSHTTMDTAPKCSGCGIDPNELVLEALGR